MTQKEGKLKERIKEFYGYETEACKYVDEAYKEFPGCDEPNHHLPTTKREDCPLLQWFVKWFGDGSK